MEVGLSRCRWVEVRCGGWRWVKVGGDVYTGLRLKWVEVEVGEVLGLGLDRIRISLVTIPLLICNGIIL